MMQSSKALKVISTPTGIYALLTAALKQPPLLAAMGTTDDRGMSRVRMMMLRGLDEKRQAIMTCADARGAKLKQIHRQPRGELCVWFPANRIQIRFLVEWKIFVWQEGRRDRNAANRLIDKWWQAMSSESRELYGKPWPGKPRDRRGAKPFSKSLWDIKKPPPTYALLCGVIKSIDALALSTPKHVRHWHQRRGNTWRSQRINP